MKNERLEATGIPDWYLNTFRVVQRVDGALRSVSAELCDLMENDALDLRVRAELLSMLDDLRSMQGSLVLVQMTAGKVLDDILSLTSEQEGRDPARSRGCRASDMGTGSPAEVPRPLSSGRAVSETARKPEEWSRKNAGETRAMQVS